MTIMLNRIQPQIPPANYVSYSIALPRPTHWRAATCDEAQCLSYLFGWETAVDESTALGQKQAHYIRHDRSRTHAETRREDGFTVFAFEAGQACFANHQVPLERPAVYSMRGGDFRGNPLGVKRRFSYAEDWCDSFMEHEDKIKTLRDRG